MRWWVIGVVSLVVGTASVQAEQPQVEVVKMPAQIGTRYFDPKRPPRERPPLTGIEEAVCAGDFLSDAAVGSQAQMTDATHVALLTDGRFSGGSHGFIIGHITPEAQEGGPIGLVRDGDRIVIDATACELKVEVSDAEMAERRLAWKTPPPKATSGVLGKYVRLVRSASEGCVTD